jgi:cytochrome c oxidase subunit 3
MQMVASPNKIKRIHPKKFALWTGIISMLMLFSAFTSAYLVRKAAGDWLYFPMTPEFFYSTAVIVSSSIVLHVAYKAFVHRNYRLYQGLLTLGFFMGITFVALQYQGWLSLNEMGIDIRTNQSSSFFVLIVGVHALHVLGGITALMISWIYALKKSTMQWSERGQLRLELTCTYWHVVDVLWIYVFLFIYLQQ